MIKKFYYPRNVVITDATLIFDYGNNILYIDGRNNTTTRYREPLGHVIEDYTSIQEYISEYTASDLLEYGLQWDEKWYVDQSFTTEVQIPYTVQSDVTFYANVADIVQYGIRVKGSNPTEIYLGTPPFGEGVEFIEERSYIDEQGFYNIATIGVQTAMNIEYNDCTISEIHIPSTVTDLSGLAIIHNTTSLHIEYDGIADQFISMAADANFGNLTQAGSVNTLTAYCYEGETKLLYNTTTASWEEIV